MKKNNLKMLLLISILLLNFGFFIQINIPEVYNDSLKEKDLKLNNQDIAIITPENKTYSKPMNGYYPATYGFENDEIGSAPEEWTLWEAGGTVTVIDSIDGHNNVLELHDTSNTDLTSAVADFSQHLYGTIEFYMRSSDPSQSNNVRIGRQAGGHLFRFGIDANNFQYYDGLWNTVGLSASSNVWYHIAIHFECTSGGYMGLSQYTWRVDINGTTYGDYSYYITYGYTDNIDFHVPDADYNVYFYIDAIGFSGDPNYNIGDNLNEGLLLGFESEIALEWFDYSLDNQPDKTILGNYTIPFPSEGMHTIKVLGNNSWGVLYQSNVRYFSIDTLTPTSMISFTPYSGINEVIKSTEFTLSADDGAGSGVSVIRYRINNSGWFDYSTAFDLSSYDYGYYMIYYYAIDVAGNIETENSLLVKLVKIPSELPISGYFIPLLIAVIGVTTTIIIKRRFKK